MIKTLTSVLHLKARYMQVLSLCTSVKSVIAVLHSAEFYLYSTVSTALVHSVKPKLTE